MPKTSIIKYAIIVMLSLCQSTAHAFSSNAPFAVLMDYDTETILYGKNEDATIAPSSMSKLMSVYLVFQALTKNEIKLDQEFVVSEKAWKVGGSTMFLEPSDKVSVEDLLKGAIIHSGNDACFTLAEGMSGDEEGFVNRMNHIAPSLGLKNSHFANVTGMPDPTHYMTMRDIAMLGKRLIKDFPDLYYLFAQKEFAYKNITQPNRNYLIGEHYIDGLKTGHTDIGGYGIAVSGKKDGRRLVAVVNGLASEGERLEEAKKLMLYGYDNFQNHHIVRANTSLASIDVWHGSEAHINAVAEDDVILSLGKDLNFDAATMTVRMERTINAPVMKGEYVADLVIAVPGDKEYIVKLVSDKNSKQLGSIGKFWSMIRYQISSFFKKLF